MKKIIEKFDFTIWFLLAGFICLLSGFYDIENIKELRIKKLESPDFFILILGLLFIFMSIGLYYLKLKFSTNTKENITQRAENITQRRFANLVYIYAKDIDAIAMGYHITHKVLLPPGTRLDVYEMPHENLIDLINLQIGLKLSYRDFWGFRNTNDYIVTNESGQKVGNTIICPSPIWTQLESHKQRPDYKNKKDSEINEHFDFIFLCVVDKAMKLKGGKRKNSDWYSYTEVEKMISGESINKTFLDVLEGFKEIKKIINTINKPTANMR